MLVLIKGAGDIATGVATRLKNSGFNIIMLDIEKPTTIRRTIAFSSAIYEDKISIEGNTGIFATTYEKAHSILLQGHIPILIDPLGKSIDYFKPQVIIDAILAKKNLGTKIDDAPIVIGLGPGFTGNVDCHAVIETQRGHYLGNVIYSGFALPNTGIPGNIGGYTSERILRSPSSGLFKPLFKIGDKVSEGDTIALVNNKPMIAEISGTLRGILYEGLEVFKGMKCGDIDPRCEYHHCFTVSDKARSIGGGVLEAILNLKLKQNL